MAAMDQVRRTAAGTWTVLHRLLMASVLRTTTDRTADDGRIARAGTDTSHQAEDLASTGCPPGLRLAQSQCVVDEEEEEAGAAGTVVVSGLRLRRTRRRTLVQRLGGRSATTIWTR